MPSETRLGSFTSARKLSAPRKNALKQTAAVNLALSVVWYTVFLPLNVSKGRKSQHCMPKYAFPANKIIQHLGHEPPSRRPKEDMTNPTIVTLGEAKEDVNNPTIVILSEAKDLCSRS
jgi:hypothetical protein